MARETVIRVDESATKNPEQQRMLELIEKIGKIHFRIKENQETSCNKSYQSSCELRGVDLANPKDDPLLNYLKDKGKFEPRSVTTIVVKCEYFSPDAAVLTLTFRPHPVEIYGDPPVTLRISAYNQEDSFVPTSYSLELFKGTPSRPGYELLDSFGRKEKENLGWTKERCLAPNAPLSRMHQAADLILAKLETAQANLTRLQK